MISRPKAVGKQCALIVGETHSSSDGLVAGHLTVGLNAMFQAVQLPAGVSDLSEDIQRSMTAKRSQMVDLQGFRREFTQAISKETGQQLCSPGYRPGQCEWR